MKITSLLIANRGEIAIRIIRAAAEMGISTVAICSEDDTQSLHTKLADRLVVLPGKGAAAYLNTEGILAAANAEGCDAVHPGYGFLSENVAFARRCATQNIIFVGPSIESLSLFGSKTESRDLAGRCGVPLLPGTNGPTTLEEAIKFFKGAGPGAVLMIKALAGGGGRGIRAVHDIAEMEEAYNRCRSEAMAAFGNGDVFVEKKVLRPRHIEIQIIGDGKHVSHLGERECTIQRHNQKIIEVAPSPSLSATLRDKLTQAALKIAAKVNYLSLGTFEFLVDASVAAEESSYAFMEVNPRLQVEHTVTEEVTGVDLVKAQLEIAAGKTLIDLDLMRDIKPRGHAMQLRINLETMDEKGSVIPESGTLSAYEVPGGKGIRVDGYGYNGYCTNPAFDSLIAKLIVHSSTSNYEDAVRKAYRALSEFKIKGVETNISFLQNLLCRSEVICNDIHTCFIDEHGQELAVAGGNHLSRYFEMAANKASTPQVENMQMIPQGTVSVVTRMKGTIVEVAVREGGAATKGQKLAVLEAMKMEHIITADCSGYIAEIYIAAGDVVEKGGVLFAIREAEVADNGKRVEEELSWKSEIDDLRQKVEKARQMGGTERIANQHAKGRLTVRERLDCLLDQGSFREIGTLAGQAVYGDDGKLQSFLPSSTVMGYGQIDGQTACVFGNDFTIKGGSSDENAANKAEFLMRMAKERRMPLVCLYDSAGGSVTEGGDHTIVPVNYGWATLTELMALVPVVTANLGTSAGWIAVQVAFSHFNVMTKNSELFVAGPPLVKRALDIDITKQQLGNYKVHAYQSGVVDNVAQDEKDAFRQIKKFLSYLPPNVWHQPPRVETDDDPNRREEELISLVPHDPRKAFDIRKLISLVVDKDSLFEYARYYGESVVTALARLNGYPVAVISNDSTCLGGAQDVPGAEKMLKFIDLADTFHLPIICMMDVPGYFIGPDSEKTGPERKAVRLHAAMHQATTPWVTVLIRRAFGVAGAGHGQYNRLNLRYSWPSGRWGSLPIAGGTLAAFRAEIEAAADPEAMRIEIEKRLADLESPIRTAHYFGLMGVEEVIDPRDTRPILCEFAKQAQEVNATQLGPKFRGMRP
jgi:acetyl/propionyl-CoA carboxylase alpha subunit/acetyl-CoA carboxylase carboxyltransferase component